MSDEALIRRAVTQADPNALRMALFQATRDPQIAAIPVERVVARGGAGETVSISEADQEMLRESAVRYLMGGAAGHVFAAPPTEQIDHLVEMAEGRPLTARQRQARRPVLCFDEFPYAARWTTGRRVLPDGFRVAIIGAGFAGIAMAVQLQLLGIPYTLLERRAEVGGVWSVNTYPDVRVDTASSTYEFGFEKNYPWSEYFARQPEVRGYLEHVTSKYGVADHIRFDHDVRDARFDDGDARWHLHVATPAGEVHLRANVVVSAAGLFATPRDFDLPGAADFGGTVLHSTEWSAEHTADGKRVAVVGNGSTGVQLLAAIAENAEHVYAFQRTPQWISPRERYGQPITVEMRWLLDNMPYYWNWNKYTSVQAQSQLHDLLVPDPDWISRGGQVNERNDAMRDGLTKYISAQVGGRADLMAHLVPDYPPMARRPVVDNNWYAALTRDNVDLVTAAIDRITETGIVTADGTALDVDLIVAAVGFDTAKYLWPTRYRGADGSTLEEAWSTEGAKAYLGMTVPGFPNLFMLYGPNSQPVSGSSGLPGWFEIWARYIAQCIIFMVEGGYPSMAVREDVYDDYNERLHRAASQLIYLTDTTSSGKNYYVNRWGRLQVNAPWSGDDFYHMCVAPDPTDFRFGPGPAAARPGGAGGAGKPAPTDLVERRRAAEAVLDALPPAPGTTFRQMSATRPGRTRPAVPVIEVVAPPVAAESPVILYFHGGGYRLGSARAFGAFASRLSGAATARVYSVDYRLAPEHPFPAAVTDAVTAYRWLRGAGHPADRIVLCGDSSGGGLAAALLLRAAAAGWPQPAGAVLMSPWLDLRLTAASYRENAESDTVFSRALASEAADQYLCGRPAGDPLASPLLGDWAGMPPLLIQAGDGEVLRDDATTLAAVARAADVQVQLSVYSGVEHDWHLAAPATPESVAALSEIGRFVRALHERPGARPR